MDGDAYIQALTKWIQKEGKRLAQRYPDPPIAISLHHLYYLLTRIDDLEVPIGPLNIRLEDINREHQASTSSSSSNYVSFKKKNTDAASIRSVSSIRSVMSTVSSSLWTGFGVFGGNARSEDQVAEDLKQLYSSFCKIPTIRICPNKSTQLISGFEEYPFDTAVPLLAFKNLQFLEVVGYHPKQFYGWDEISEQLRSLVLKKSGIHALESLTLDVIKDELEKKRRKAERGTRYWQNLNDNGHSVPSSPRPGTQNSYFAQQKTSNVDVEGRPRSASPNSTTYQRPTVVSRRSGRYDRLHMTPPVVPDVPPIFTLPVTKWRFLRFLSLSDNGLSDISIEALAPLADNLNFLDLSKNDFATIPAALSTLSALRSLDMAKNKLESLHCLLQHPLPGISTLNLRGNRLHSIAGIDRLPSLERIDLRENLLKDPMEMARLNAAPNFSDVWVVGNPFTRTHYNYRTSIFNIFRCNAHMVDDITLDGKKPGMLEKRSLDPRAMETMPSVKVAPSVQTTPTGPVALKKDSDSTSTYHLDDEERNVRTRKKVHKSRVIDLASGGDKVASQRDPSTSPASARRETIASPTKTEIREKVSGEEYRKKIEALKQEVGSGWIRAINEESLRKTSTDEVRHV